MRQDSSQLETQSGALRGIGYAALAAIIWWLFVPYGPFGTMFWFIFPLALVCFLYVTAMLRLVELSALPKLFLTVAAPAPALILEYVRVRRGDTLSQTAIVLTAEFIALVALLMSLPSLVAYLKSNNAFKGDARKRAHP